MANIDMQRCVEEILSALRGSKSQMALSRALGYSFNQVHRWEKGITQIAWSDYLRFADRCKINPSEQLRLALAYSDSAYDVSQLLSFLFARTDLTKVSETSGISLFSLKRWLQKKAEPKLCDILRLVEVLTPCLADLAQALSGGHSLPLFAGDQQKIRKQRETLRGRPWLTALLAALESSNYEKAERHDPRILAASLSLDESEIEDGLCELEKMGNVHFQSGKWTIVAKNVNAGQEEDAAAYRYWNERTADFFERSHKKDGRWCLMVLCGKSDSLKRIRGIFTDFLRQAREIAMSDASDSRNVAFLQFSLGSPTKDRGSQEFLS